MDKKSLRNLNQKFPQGRVIRGRPAEEGLLFTTVSEAARQRTPSAAGLGHGLFGVVL
jgi:hypothetical protein